MILPVLLWAASALPTIKAVEAGARPPGWTSAGDAIIDRERFPVPFPIYRRVAYLRNPSGSVSVEIAILGRRGGRLDSLGIKMLFSGSPDATVADIAAGEALLTRLGLPADAVAATHALLARAEAAPDPDMAYMKPFVPERQHAGGLVIDSRARFITGAAGRYGQVAVQFTPADAPELDWPSVQAVETLVPMEERVMLSGNSDVPSFLDPAITTMTCRRVAKTYRCRYQTTVADWIGTDPPRSRFEHDYRQGSDGSWTLVQP